MPAHFAAPIVGIIGDARQQLAGFGRLDYRDGTVAHRLCQLRIKWLQEMQSLGSIGVDDADDK
jgi:hypothetical protein